ncbi:MAG TPA: hypothetical protein VN032_08570 [Thermoanaerobaculia bacterium]|jgi:hypothetical protein|nr:hypothetical protein [Thermoanaerobaculia bacterium]
MVRRRTCFVSGRVLRLAVALAVLAPAALMAGPRPGVAPPARGATVACAQGATTLCLSSARFQVSVQWRDFQGNTGAGQAVGLTADTGYFWFFTNTNVELVVKVLDATAINGHFWVFYGALSNVEYVITVTDTANGQQRTYSNPSGQFGSAGDTQAFPTGTGSSVTALGGASVPGGSLEASPVAARAARRSARAKAGACAPDATALCLADGRFRVEVNWTDFQGHSGRGQAIGLTADTGYFWFFTSANVELVVKALDARAVNGNFWVFYGALSNVGYEVVVLDTQTGESRRYRNPPTQFASAGDTAAFPLAPGTPIPAVTDVGTASGEAVSATIGAAGGVVVSQDGNATLSIPPNAVSGPVAFTIQPISNEAPGGAGGGYRLGPEGQTFALPAQLSFRSSGTLADSAGVAYQDAQHVWRELKASSLNQAAKTVTAPTSHLSDWALVQGFALAPSEAQVHVGNSLGLALASCFWIDEDESTRLVAGCAPATGDVTTSAWAVNGVAGGNATTGTVTASGDHGGSFTAPAQKPTPNVVAVSAVLGGSGQGSVVSNLTIVDDALPDSWVGTADGAFAGASATVQVTWTLDRTANNVSTYHPSGTAHYSFMDCTITPADGSLATDGFLTIDYNAHPATYDGIGDGFWIALFNCPGLDPGENPVTFLYFDSSGVVSADGTTIEGSGVSGDGVWTIHWHFVHHVPGSP